MYFSDVSADNLVKKRTLTFLRKFSASNNVLCAAFAVEANRQLAIIQT